MPQERALLDWVEREGLGRAFTSADTFVGVLRERLDSGAVASPPPHPNRGAGSNRAAREIPGVVEEILRLSKGGA